MKLNALKMLKVKIFFIASARTNAMERLESYSDQRRPYLSSADFKILMLSVTSRPIQLSIFAHLLSLFLLFNHHSVQKASSHVIFICSAINQNALRTWTSHFVSEANLALAFAHASNIALRKHSRKVLVGEG